jgi:hypothetical protein
MSSQPRPADIAKYQAKLAELIAARDAFRVQHNDHKVKAVSRRIQAQLKWIKRANAHGAE